MTPNQKIVILSLTVLVLILATANALIPRWKNVELMKKEVQTDERNDIVSMVETCIASTDPEVKIDFAKGSEGGIAVVARFKCSDLRKINQVTELEGATTTVQRSARCEGKLYNDFHCTNYK